MAEFFFFQRRLVLSISNLQHSQVAKIGHHFDELFTKSCGMSHVLLLKLSMC